MLQHTSSEVIVSSICAYNYNLSKALFTRRSGNPTARVTLARGLKDSSGL